MQPFSIDHRSAQQSHVDLSFLLDAPAGRDGFVTVQGGHLVKPSGQRLRLWGVNVTDWTPGSVMLPAKHDAPIYAAALARFGINCVRLHFLDLFAPRGIIDPTHDDTVHFDADQLDRLDFWVAQLKQRGIYCDLNLMVGRSYKAGDDVADHDQIGWAKAISFASPRLIALQKQYARQLLTHVNPYTGSEYRHEPAIVIVELVNENSLVEAWWHGRTHPTQPLSADPNWRPLPVFYADMLTEQYNAYLAQHLSPTELAEYRALTHTPAGQPVQRLHRSAFAAAPAHQFQTEAGFYMHVERSFFCEMRDFLRGDLGVQSLLLGSSDHNHEWSGYPTIWANAALDILDGHDYWQHEAFPGKKNTPMVNEPLASTVARLARTAVAGMPFIVSEVNNPFPHDWMAEGIPTLAAYASLQDWDGVIWYTVELKSDPAWPASLGDAFDMLLDPVKMPQLAAGALLFLRGDVRAARQLVQRSYSPEQLRETLRMDEAHAPYYTPGFSPALALQHRVRIGSLEQAAQAAYPPAEAGALAADTGELCWQVSPEHGGVITVDTELSQALIGFLAAGRPALRHLSAYLENPFCAITLAALDDLPIARSARLLLTAAAKVENTGQRWNEERTKATNYGHAPAQIEPVRGSITLGQIDLAQEVRITPLDGAGLPLGPASLAQRTAQGWRFAIGSPATPWYEIIVSRAIA